MGSSSVVAGTKPARNLKSRGRRFRLTAARKGVFFVGFLHELEGIPRFYSSKIAGGIIGSLVLAFLILSVIDFRCCGSFSIPVFNPSGISIPAITSRGGAGGADIPAPRRQTHRQFPSTSAGLKLRFILYHLSSVTSGEAHSYQSGAFLSLFATTDRMFRITELWGTGACVAFINRCAVTSFCSPKTLRISSIDQEGY